MNTRSSVHSLRFSIMTIYAGILGTNSKHFLKTFVGSFRWTISEFFFSISPLPPKGAEPLAGPCVQPGWAQALPIAAKSRLSVWDMLAISWDCLCTWLKFPRNTKGSLLHTCFLKSSTWGPKAWGSASFTNQTTSSTVQVKGFLLDGRAESCSGEGLEAVGTLKKKANSSALQWHAVASLVCEHAAVWQPHVLDVRSECISLRWWGGERKGLGSFLLTGRHDPSWWIVLKNMKASGSCWGRKNVPAARLLNRAAPAVWCASSGDFGSGRHHPPTWRESASARNKGACHWMWRPEDKIRLQQIVFFFAYRSSDLSWSLEEGS